MMKLYGKIPVLERLRTNPKSIKHIYLEEGHRDAFYVHRKCKKWGISLVTIPRSKMLKIARSLNTQGILVEIEDFAYTPFDDLLEEVLKKRQSLLLLDEITDPQNFGGIIRTAACLGDFAIVIPTHGSVSVTDTVLRIAAGAENYIKVAQISNINHAIMKAREAGFTIAGSVVQDGQNLAEASLSFPLAMVIGSEQKGIREVIKKNLDVLVTIPMRYQGLSLNVAHATTVLCYEIMRQKNQNKR